MFLFQNLTFIRPDNFDDLPELKKQQVIRIYNLQQFDDEKAYALAKKELYEVPCEWWQVVKSTDLEKPLYDFVIAFEDGRAFISGTLTPAEIYLSQGGIQFDDDLDAEEELQNAYDDRERPSYQL